MQNFMKTIISAVQAWTTGKIKDSTADWNENDSNKDSYVKNRTHWEEVKEIAFFDNLTFADYDAGDAPGCNFVPNQKYNIIWNGALYETTCYFDGEYNIIADNNLGCPFYIDDDGGNGLYIESDDESTDWVVSVFTTQSIIHKLDPKYLKLPTNIATTDNVQEAIDLANEAYNAIGIKMDATNPVGTGSFSMNRKAGSTIGDYSHTEGYQNTASGDYSHAEGSVTTASGYYSHAEGRRTTASGDWSHTEGESTTARGDHSHAEGLGTTASGIASHAEGSDARATGDYSHAEGYLTTTGAEGAATATNITTAESLDGKYAHAEGYGTVAEGRISHAEGNGTTASGHVSHAEGMRTTASGHFSHAEGYDSVASGSRSHAEGNDSVASGNMSHAEGTGTVAKGYHSHVEGMYNISDDSPIDRATARHKYVHIVGNGTSDTKRSNAHTLDWSGNAWYQGDVYVGGTSQDDASVLATEQYVDEAIANFDDIDAVTIDIDDAAEGTAIGVNADTFGGYTIDSFVMYNTEGDINFKIPSMTKVTLLSSNWNNNTQTVEVTGIVADETAQIITVVPYNTVDNIAACSGIICTEQGINSLTFTATDEVPNVDVEFVVSWQEVNWI